MGDARAELVVQVAKPDAMVVEAYTITGPGTADLVRSDAIAGAVQPAIDGVLADVDRDGRLDAIFAMGREVVIARGFDRTEPDIEVVEVGKLVIRLDAGDVNGDGAVDIILNGFSGDPPDPAFPDPVWVIQQVP